MKQTVLSLLMIMIVFTQAFSQIKSNKMETTVPKISDFPTGDENNPVAVIIGISTQVVFTIAYY